MTTVSEHHTNHIAVVWPHGIQYVPYILADLTAAPDTRLRVVSYWRREVTTKDWGRFIDLLYSRSEVPVEHLVAKTDYIRSLGSGTVLIMLLEDYDPEEQVVGEPTYRILQDVKLQALKQRIRTRWNTRIYGPDGGPGRRSEDHIIHCTDSGGDVAWLAPALGIPDYGFFHRYDDSPIRCSPWVAPFDFAVHEVTIEDLKVHQIGDGQIPIGESISAGWLKEPCVYYDRYLAYWSKTYGKECVEDHGPWRYLMLENSWRVGDPRDIPVVYQGSVIDGAHRLCLMRWRDGITKTYVAEVTRWR